jgi:hypothetical protein
MSLAMLWGCASTERVLVPPRVDLSGYGTLGLIEFSSNAGPAVNARATRLFQEQVQAAQPGTRFIELGSREMLLAAVGAQQLDVDAYRRIGEQYQVSAVFVGDILYSAPRTDVRVSDLAKLEGDVRAEVRGDMSGRLVETRTGASVWSGSSWARREVGRLKVSGGEGVSGAVSQGGAHEEMVPALVRHLTHDFRPTTVRQRVR